MIDDVAWELIPDSFPDGTPLWVEPALDDAGVDDERYRRAYAWAHRLLSQLSAGRSLNTVMTASIGHLRQPRIADISAGFIPFALGSGDARSGSREQYLEVHPNVPTAKAEDRMYSFGIVIGVPVETDSEEEGIFVREPSVFVTLDGGFPVIVERRAIVEDAPPDPSGNATSTCYAKPRQNKRYYCGIRWTDGILVARHPLSVLGTTPGVTVPLTNGLPAPIGDIDASTTIDAAVLDIGANGVPSSAVTLRQALVSPIGSGVTVRGKRSSFKADVLRVMDDPHYFGNMVAHRVFIDNYGSSGDSGALVTSNCSSEAIGIYIGKTGGITNEGLIQSMRQVCEYFEIDLLD